MEGFSGFSSLRLGIWVVSLFAIALSGWIFAFTNSIGKNYRFAMLAPIFMLSFQLGVYVLDARISSVNEFSTKVMINSIFALLLIALYFLGKSRSK